MRQASMGTGVSIVICSYNSSQKIFKSLQSIAGQVFDQAIAVEIILVDNASTDDTAVLSFEIWKSFGIAVPLTILHEPRPGQRYARECGVKAAVNDIILFCDDDNWLFPDYLQTVYLIMKNDPGIAACGGHGIPVFENNEPAWFQQFEEVFALGPQGNHKENGRILTLYGAGMAIRKNTYEALYATGFNPVMQGRAGVKLSASEDTELSYCFVLMGYRLFYSSDLKFYHYMPAERLTKNYLHRIFRACGSDGPVRNIYYSHVCQRGFHKKIRNWNVHLMLCLARIFKYMVKPPKKAARLIYLEWSFSYLQALFKLRNHNDRIVENILKIQYAGSKNNQEKINE